MLILDGNGCQEEENFDFVEIAKVWGLLNF